MKSLLFLGIILMVTTTVWAKSDSSSAAMAPDVRATEKNASSGNSAKSSAKSSALNRNQLVRNVLAPSDKNDILSSTQNQLIRSVPSPAAAPAESGLDSSKNGAANLRQTKQAVSPKRIVCLQGGHEIRGVTLEACAEKGGVEIDTHEVITSAPKK